MVKGQAFSGNVQQRSASSEFTQFHCYRSQIGYSVSQGGQPDRLEQFPDRRGPKVRFTNG